MKKLSKIDYKFAFKNPQNLTKIHKTHQALATSIYKLLFIHWFSHKNYIKQIAFRNKISFSFTFNWLTYFFLDVVILLLNVYKIPSLTCTKFVVVVMKIKSFNLFGIYQSIWRQFYGSKKKWGAEIFNLQSNQPADVVRLFCVVFSLQSK